MGEFEFIDVLRCAFGGIGDERIVGIGDDAAVIPISADTGISGGDEALVVTTDMLVEGIHFLRNATSARELGGKALAVNLSDIAAMGARPVASFLSVALPAECRGEWAMEFMEGYRELSACHEVKPAGGDTTSSLRDIVINVAVVGRVPMKNLKYRSGARVGDIVAVGGPLGESAAGLKDILDGKFDTIAARVHRNPVVQVAEGEWIGGRQEVHAMMDLSDGLASDLVHILRASSERGENLGAEIDLEAIPTSVSVDLALAGGEDYKLLMTVAAEDWEALAADYKTKFGTELHAIGRIVSGESKIVWMDGGEPVERDWKGFAHF